MLKAAIFDIDGTLVDSNEQHARAWERAFAHFGFDVPVAAIRPHIGKGGDQLIPVFLDGENLKRFGEAVDHYKTELFMREYLPQVRPFPKVTELFERIRRQGTRVVLATSAKAEELDAYRRLCPALSLANEQTSSDEAEHSKPCPDIFAAALQRAKARPEEAVVIGDSPYDARAATALGVRALGVLCGGFAEEVLRAAGCCAIYLDPADLLAHFEESPLALRRAA